MTRLLKRLADRIGRLRIVRSLIARIVYPTIARNLLEDIVPDGSSGSGLAEAFAWKTHAYLVLESELRSGRNCAPERMRSDWETRARLLDAVIESIADVRGDILEFGVAAGESFRVFAERCRDRTVYGFDGFEGLPEAWWSRPKGAFKSAPPQLNLANARLLIGWFDETVPEFLRTWQGPAALIHVDCDLYSSTCASLLPVLRRAQEGTVVLFDEYYNYPGFAEHEWRAWQEAKERYGIVAQCIGYDGRRAAFQISRIGQPPFEAASSGLSLPRADASSLSQ